MHCADLQAFLVLYIDRMLEPSATQQVESHLQQCSLCRERVDTEQHTLSLIRAAAIAGTPALPAEGQRRLELSLRQARRRQQLRRAAFAASAAAALALAFWTGIRYQRWTRLEASVRSVAEMHARQYPLEVRAGQGATLEQWFGGKLDHRVSIPKLPQLEAEGARLIHVGSHPAAYIRYRQAAVTDPLLAHSLGLFVYSNRGDEFGIDPEVPAFGQSMGFHVTTWRDGDLMYQLVSDTPDAPPREVFGKAAGSRNSPVQPASYSP